MAKLKYYNMQWILSCNRIFNYILGGRGIGKSFTVKKYCIDKFLKNKRQFVYSRRYIIDIDKTAPHYFDDIAQMYPDHKFVYNGGVFYIDNEVAGYAVAVNSFIKMKSIAYPDVDTIVFDEFITENADYIGGTKNPFLEPELCLNFYQTVARGLNRPIREEVKFIFISNAVSINNPHFLYYDLDKKLLNGAKHILTDSIAVEIAEGTDIINEISNSQFGKLIKHSKYGDYALDNKFYLDSDEFINKLPANCIYKMTIRQNNKNYGIWLDNNDNMYYVSEKYDPDCSRFYSLDNLSHNDKTLLIKSLSADPVVKLIKLAYSYGHFRFSNQRCKAVIINFLGY